MACLKCASASPAKAEPSMSKSMLGQKAYGNPCLKQLVADHKEPFGLA